MAKVLNNQQTQTQENIMLETRQNKQAQTWQLFILST
jgi:hypothetical protein